MAPSHTEVSGKVSKDRPKVQSRAVVGTNKLGSDKVRFETCWYDDKTSAHVRAFQGHCSRPTANPEFFNNVIELPHGWTNVIYHSSYQHGLDKMLLNGMTAGGMGWKEGRQACYCSAAHPEESKAMLNHKS